MSDFSKRLKRHPFRIFCPASLSLQDVNITEKVSRGTSCHMQLMVFYGVRGFLASAKASRVTEFRLLLWLALIRQGKSSSLVNVFATSGTLLFLCLPERMSLSDCKYRPAHSRGTTVFYSIRKQAKLNFHFMGYLSVVFLLSCWAVYPTQWTSEKLQGRFGIDISWVDAKPTHKTLEWGWW